MENGRNFWWLVALEATLFFSLPCWEFTAIWAAPISHPARFGVALVVTAAVATFSCHVGPALFAARFGGRLRRITWVVLVWLSVGYVEWLGSLAHTEAEFPGFLPNVLPDLGALSRVSITVAGRRRRLGEVVVEGRCGRLASAGFEYSGLGNGDELERTVGAESVSYTQP